MPHDHWRVNLRRQRVTRRFDEWNDTTETSAFAPTYSSSAVTGVKNSSVKYSDPKQLYDPLAPPGLRAVTRPGAFTMPSARPRVAGAATPAGCVWPGMMKVMSLPCVAIAGSFCSCSSFRGGDTGDQPPSTFSTKAISSSGSTASPTAPCSLACVARATRSTRCTGEP